MITAPGNFQAMLNDLVNNGIFIVCDAGAPTNGTTGANLCGIGSLYVNKTNGKWYTNTGTLASPTWTVVGTQT